MAHFAKVENGLVTQVIVTDNDYPGEGFEWLEDNFGGTWIKTSYNASIRGKFASIGDIYDEVKDEFVAQFREQPVLIENIGIDESDPS